MNALLTAGATFGIFAAINVCWTLIIGTASIFSLATYAVVGTAAFVTSLLSIRTACPGMACRPSAPCIGLGFGVLIAAPALRLDGFYYALLTLGLNELFRVFFTTSKQFGSASGGLYGADSFINQNWPPLTQSLVAYYASLEPPDRARCFSFRFINGKRLGRVLRMAPEKHEAFAAAGRGGLQAGADHHLPPHLGGARLHRRLLCGAVSRRRLFDLRFPDRAARARDDHHRWDRPRRGCGARHVRR